MRYFIIGCVVAFLAIGTSPSGVVTMNLSTDRAEAGFGKHGHGGGRAYRGGGRGGGAKARPHRPPSGSKIRPGRPGKPDYAARPNRPKPGNRPGAGGRPNKPDYANRPNRPGAGDRPNRPGSGNRPNRPDYGNRPNRPGSGNRPNRPDYGNRPNRPNRPGYGNRPNRPGYGNRPPGWRPPHYRPPHWRPPAWRPPAYRPPYYRPPHYRWGRYNYYPSWGWYFTAAVAGATLVYVATLPDDKECERVTYQGETLYQCDGVLYRSTLYEDEEVYEIVSSQEESVAAAPSAGRSTELLRLTSPVMRGERVRSLQQALVDRGYDVGGVDGVFGSGVDRALRAFQSDNGLTPNGILDEQTAVMLGV
jgi:hypothetical protein